MMVSEIVAGTDRTLELADIWAAAFAGVVESLVGTRPSWECRTENGSASGEKLLGWQQSFERGPQPAMWAALVAEGWTETGRSVLVAAGVESIHEEEISNTLREMLAQAFSSFAVSASARLGAELSVSTGAAADLAPEGWRTIRIEFRLQDGVPAIALVAVDPGWAVGEGSSQDSEGPTVEPEAATASPMDLLLDVELPVSVSFGRTRLPLEDLLKLGAGSVIELGRNIDDPVELIVNNRVVALGEVVVVDGNYGVRIQRIASRADRLRTGSAATRPATEEERR
jgi:flagellar motor switch protein FliN/FliY